MFSKNLAFFLSGFAARPYSTRRVVSFHYKLKSSEGTQLENSWKTGTPLTYLEGSYQIIPGLENAIKKLSEGDKQTVAVPAKEAYGEYDPSSLIVTGRSNFPVNTKVEVGGTFNVRTQEGGLIQVTITKIEGDEVTLDPNHPMAGKDLIFEVEIVETRDATDEELQRGHLHGPGYNHSE
eukprot:TRINITY_DN4457_c0_g1_i9.p1 TRINITY_DN4457_c0_g1~~TRINITY_DN4457_c0_g1_i9.p1  ORF type:complete len:179 (+),score=37.51 TRINITY_DN4457_c0_g1_i9:277-813(+)